MYQLNSTSMLSIALCLVLLVLATLLIYLQRKADTFDLRWLILDDVTLRPSIHKIGQGTALLLSSWGFVYLALHDKLTETYFTLYMTIWAATEAVNKLTTKKPTTGDTDGKN